MISKEDKERIKVLFNEWMDRMDARTAINDEIKEMKKEVADILNVKTAVVTKLFSYLSKIYSGGDDELEELKILMDDIRE